MLRQMQPDPWKRGPSEKDTRENDAVSLQVDDGFGILDIILRQTYAEIQ
jgi:hypothetical protein